MKERIAGFVGRVTRRGTGDPAVAYTVYVNKTSSVKKRNPQEKTRRLRVCIYVS